MSEDKNSGKKYLFLITGMVMGGAERVMATIANEFVGRGNEIVIVTMKEPKSAYRLDSNIKIYGAMGTYNEQKGIKGKLDFLSSGIKGVLFYIKQLKSYKPDAVLSFLTKTNLLAVIIRLFFVRNIPVIISERADPLVRGRVTRRFCEMLYPRSDCLVCQSEKVSQYFLSINKKTNIQIIPNPINEECISYITPKKRRKVIVAVGRLSKQKNYDLLIKSFDEIKDEFSDYSIEIYGQGPEKEYLIQLIHELDLEKRVLMMGTRKNVMKEIYDSSLYVMSSYYEGFPNALIEAMASGLPVISTDFPTGIAREVIVDGVNGFVVQNNNKIEMACSISKILSDTKLQNEMSKNNRDIIKVLNKNQIINKWESVLNGFIK